MGKESKTLMDAIRNDINRSSGKGFANFFGIRESGQKCRIRFLQDFEEGLAVTFHDKWQAFNHPCLSYYGKECPNCDNPEARTNSVYYWNVYNYETKKVELFGYKANKATPIPGLAAVYEAIGDITAQDIIIQRNGTGTGTTYSVIPTGKEITFKKNVKLFSKKQIFKMLLEVFDKIEEDVSDEVYDDDDYEYNPKKSSKSKTKNDYDDDDEDEDEVPFDMDDDDEEEEEEEIPAKKPKAKTKAKSKKKVVEEDDEEDEYFDDDDDFDDEDDFDDDEDEDFDDEDDDEELPPPKRKNKSGKKGKSKKK